MPIVVIILGTAIADALIFSLDRDSVRGFLTLAPFARILQSGTGKEKFTVVQVHVKVKGKLGHGGSISETESVSKPKHRITECEDEKNIQEVTDHSQLPLDLFVVHGDILLHNGEGCNNKNHNDDALEKRFVGRGHADIIDPF